MEIFGTVLFIIMAITGTVAAKNRGGYKEAMESCNNYIDSILSNIMIAQGEHLDPYVSEDSVLHFYRKVVFVDVKGEVKLAPGYLSGLNTLRRASSCAMSFEKERLKLSAKLHIQHMAFNATGSLKFMNRHSKIIVKGDASHASVNMAFTLNFTTGKEAVLDEFHFVTMRDKQISLIGSRFVRWLHSAVKRAATTLLEIVIRNAIDYKIGSLVMEEIISNPFSLEGFEIDEEEIVGPPTSDVAVTTPSFDEDNIPTGKTAYTKEDANTYIDSVIENRFVIEADYSKLDPYRLSDIQIDNAFPQKTQIEEQLEEESNYLEFRNGRLKHLSKARRICHCTKPVSRGGNVTFECILGFDDVQLKYEASNGDNVFDYDIIASVADTQMSFTIISNQIYNITQLQDFTVQNIGNFTVKAAKIISDSTCFSKRSYNLEPILRYFQNTFFKVLIGKFQDVFNYSVYRTPFQFLKA